MKKTFKFAFVIVFALTLSACAQKEAGKKEVKDPLSGAEDMLNLKDRASEEIKNANEKENNRLTNTLNEKNMKKNESLPDNSELVEKYPFALLKTSLGDIKVKFYGTDSPVTVGNFLKLSQDGFFDGTKFHRVIKDFMIQGGDPLSKDDSAKSRWGTGDPGYKFQDEFNEKKLVAGSLAMANSGPNTNGSQFFIVTAVSTPWLDGKHTNFGEVVSGMEIVKKIENAPTTANDQPETDVIVKSIELLEK
jgi:cyclophilin family peptidyl-prolyl cis-trans isomerase